MSDTTPTDEVISVSSPASQNDTPPASKPTVTLYNILYSLVSLWTIFVLPNVISSGFPALLNIPVSTYVQHDCDVSSPSPAASLSPPIPPSPWPSPIRAYNPGSQQLDKSPDYEFGDIEERGCAVSIESASQECQMKSKKPRDLRGHDTSQPIHDKLEELKNLGRNPDILKRALESGNSLESNDAVESKHPAEPVKPSKTTEKVESTARKIKLLQLGHKVKKHFEIGFTRLKFLASLLDNQIARLEFWMKLKTFGRFAEPAKGIGASEVGPEAFKEASDLQDKPQESVVQSESGKASTEVSPDEPTKADFQATRVSTDWIDSFREFFEKDSRQPQEDRPAEKSSTSDHVSIPASFHGLPEETNQADKNEFPTGQDGVLAGQAEDNVYKSCATLTKATVTKAWVRLGTYALSTRAQIRDSVHPSGSATTLSIFILLAARIFHTIEVSLVSAIVTLYIAILYHASETLAEDSPLPEILAILFLRNSRWPVCIPFSPYLLIALLLLLSRDSPFDSAASAAAAYASFLDSIMSAAREAVHNVRQRDIADTVEDTLENIGFAINDLTRAFVTDLFIHLPAFVLARLAFYADLLSSAADVIANCARDGGKAYAERSVLFPFLKRCFDGAWSAGIHVADLAIEASGWVKDWLRACVGTLTISIEDSRTREIDRRRDAKKSQESWRKIREAKERGKAEREKMDGEDWVVHSLETVMEEDEDEGFVKA